MILDWFKRRAKVPEPPRLELSPPARTSLGFTTTEPPIQNALGGSTLRYSPHARSAFYRYLRDHIPIVSAGIWTWVRLCSTEQNLRLLGPDGEVARASRIAQQLQKRIYPRMDGEVDGLSRLTESLFLDLFTLGRVAMRVQLQPDRSGIRSLEVVDPFQVKWKRNGSGQHCPVLMHEEGREEPLAQETFFHRSLITDFHQPEGVEPLACIPFVVEIEQRMLEDMARSSHNAGTQRLQVRMAPPERSPGEDEEAYSGRINSYFDSTVRQFRELGPDDNVFTWSDVEVSLIGGTQGEGSTWKVNREQVIEDVITGLKLFPWTLGRSHGTTKNWIFAQYNLLMQIVDSIQRMGSDLAQWLLWLELRLRGNRATPQWLFSPNQDPFIVERSRAKLMELERVERMVEKGFISRSQGRRELGYGEGEGGET